MKLESIFLRDFRNIAQLELHPGEGVNLIHGRNGQGKTNLIEAIWLFSGMKSFRSAKESEMLRFGAASSALQATFYSEGRQQTAQLVLGEGKELTLNGVKRESVSELCGIFPAVVFSPVHLSLVKEGPAQRRKFIDGAVSQLLPAFRRDMRSYARALLQRNALLRDVAHNAQLLDMLDVWDHNLAASGARIIRLRQRYVRRVHELACESYEGISAGSEKLEVSYHCSLEGAAPGMEDRELAACFLTNLRQRRGEDIRQGATSVGAHRDDLELTLDGVSARQYGSQGQQRSCVLALKLAECGIIEASVDSAPVILLDDVMSELDKGRRDYLLHRIAGRQVFITCCEEELFSGGGAQGMRLFAIERGCLQAG